MPVCYNSHTVNMLKTRSELDKRYQKISKTAASYDFFIAIHDFVGHIESQKFLLRRASRPGKYQYLKDIYQGIEDIKPSLSDKDLGHARCMAALDLGRIKKNDVSENNVFWRKREFFRKTAGEVYNQLVVGLV